MSVNISGKGVQATAGLPGSGVSYRTKRRKIGTSHRPIWHASDTTSAQAWLLEVAARLRK
jgi:hypothetical protein